MDEKKGEPIVDESGKNSLEKRFALSTDGNRPSNAVRTGARSNARRLEGTLVPRRQIGKDGEAEADHFARAQDVQRNVVLALVWEELSVIVYVKLRVKHLDVRDFGALSSHEPVPNNNYRGSFVPR